MRLMNLCLLASLSGFGPSLLAVETKLSCTEVAATETKCAEYDTASKACDVEVDAAIKVKKDQAKTAADECKKKNGIGYMLKCKKEIKDSTTAVNAPRQVAASPIQKELVAKAGSSCAKAETLGNATAICKSPKAVLDAIKRNCIK